MKHKLFSPYLMYEPKSGDPVLLDKYTFAHILGGYLMQKIGLSERMAILLALGYELIEDDLIEALGLKRWKVEGKGNALVDVVAAIAGFEIARRHLK